MKTDVLLLGSIGDKFGDKFSMDIEKPSEAFQCLDANFPEFKKYLVDCAESNIGFTIHADNEPVTDEDELLLPINKGTLAITATPVGSESAGAKIVAAIAIAALVIINPGALLIKAGSLTAAGQVAVGLSINLALTGVQQLLAPDPATDQEKDESYLFDGSTQNIVEGDPVPVLYGRLRVPGRPISFEVLNRKFTGASNSGVGTNNFLDGRGPYGGFTYIP